MTRGRSNSNPVLPWGLHQVYDNTQAQSACTNLVDLIAVHGLGAHPDHAWVRHQDFTNGLAKDTHWLVDLLPEFLASQDPRIAVRVFYFSYQSAWVGKSTTKNRLMTVASQLLEGIRNLAGQAGTAERPILFLGHSFGGLVIEQAIVLAGSTGNPNYSLLQRCGGFILFGTPHKESKAQTFGITIAHLLQMAEYGVSIMIDEMNDDSMRVFDLRSAFMQLVHHLGLTKAVVCFCENEKTSYMQRVAKLGARRKWVSAMVVDEASAVLDGVDYFLLDSDHLKLNKFIDGKDKNYEVVAAHIARIATQAPTLLSKRRKDDRSASETYYLVGRQRVQRFVGRENELADILTYFSTTLNQSPRTLVLHAMGGQGKSQLALEYCQRSREMQTYKGIFWVNANSKALLLDSYRAILRKINPQAFAALSQDPHEVCTRLVESLESWQDRWLIILDNYDNPKEFPRIRECIPTSDCGDVLITSRHNKLDRLGCLMRLEALPSEAGVDLLLHGFDTSTIEHKHRDVAAKIVKRLGSLALAIDQAASYISYQQTRLDNLDEFLVLYETKRGIVLGHVPDDFWEYTTEQFDGDESKSRAINAFTTWEMSLQQLFMIPGFQASDIEQFLLTAAFLSPLQVQEFLFKLYLDAPESYPKEEWLLDMFISKDNPDEDTTYVSGPQHTHHDRNVDKRFSRQKYWALVAKLQTLSLAENFERPDGTIGATFRLHPLIRDWIQLRKGLQRAQESIGTTIRIIGTCTVHKKMLEADLVQRARLLEHINVSLDNDTRLCQSAYFSEFVEPYTEILGTFASSFFRQGLYRAALELYRRIKTMQTKVLDEGDPRVITTALNLAKCLVNLPDYEAAEQLLWKTRKIQIESHREGGPAFKVTICTLIDVLRLQTKFGEAKPIVQRALELGYNEYDSNDDICSASISAIAIFWIDTGEPKRAEELIRKTLEMGIVAQFGEKDSRVLNLMLCLGHSLMKQRKHPEAETLFQNTLVRYVESHGEKHPETLRVMQNLAISLIHQGKIKGLELLQSLVKVRTEVHGKHHPETRRAKKNLDVAMTRFRSLEEQENENEEEEWYTANEDSSCEN